MFFIAFVYFLVSFQAKTANAATPIGVAQCGGKPQYWTCTELTGIISGPPISIQNLGPPPCFPDPGNPNYQCPAAGFQANQCKIGWSNGYTLTQVAEVNNSCGQTYSGEVLGSWKGWGVNEPVFTYTAPIVPTP